MSKYYCHPCASSMGELNNIHSSAPTASTYQIEKYFKHTISPRNAHYYIIDDGAGPDKAFIRQCREIDAK